MQSSLATPLPAPQIREFPAPFLVAPEISLFEMRFGAGETPLSTNGLRLAAYACANPHYALRDPKARFDPRKLNSPSVMAGLAGAGILWPYFVGAPRPMPDQ